MFTVVAFSLPLKQCYLHICLVNHCGQQYKHLSQLLSGSVGLSCSVCVKSVLICQVFNSVAELKWRYHSASVKVSFSFNF